MKRESGGKAGRSRLETGGAPKLEKMKPNSRSLSEHCLTIRDRSRWIGEGQENKATFRNGRTLRSAGQELQYDPKQLENKERAA